MKKNEVADDVRVTRIPCCSSIPQRWITVFVIFFSLFNAFSMRVCLSIAITKMVIPLDNRRKFSDDTCPGRNNTDTMSTASYLNRLHSDQDLFDWSEYTQGIVLSSFYWTYSLTSIFGGTISGRLGGKYTLGIGILLSSVLTLLTPASVRWGGSTALICVRALMGLGEGASYSALNVLMAQWIPPNERSKAASVAFAGTPIGTMFSMTVSGFILQYAHEGWPIVFYFLGTVGLTSFLLTCMFCHNKPSQNPSISEAEIEYLRKNLKNTHSDLPSTPWRHILRSAPVWALTIMKIGNVWGLVSLTIMPKYLSGVLKFSAKENGYLSSMPYLAMWVFGFIASSVSDPLIVRGRMSTTMVRKIAGSLAALGPGVFFVTASYAGCNGLVVVALLTIGMLLSGCGYCSVLVLPLDLAPNYAHSIMGFVNGIGTLSGILSPYIVGILTPNQTISEWRVVFWIIFAVFLVSNTVFLIFGSGNVQDWNDPVFLKKEEHVNKNVTKEEVQILSVK